MSPYKALQRPDLIMVERSPPLIAVQSPAGNPSLGLLSQELNSPDGGNAENEGRFSVNVVTECEYTVNVPEIGSMMLRSNAVANSLCEARPISNGLSFPTKLIRTLSSNGNSLGQTSGSEGRQDSQAPIDPLSQVCEHVPFYLC